MKHPIQYITTDSAGTIRFTENKIIRYMVDECTDLNTLCAKFKDEDKEDWDQLMQLIGYSVSGAPINHDILNIADVMVDEEIDERDAKIMYYEIIIDNLKEALREPVASLFHIHPDDLGEI